MANANQNNPRKELTYALFGVVLFLVLVLIIAISGYIRPAGPTAVAANDDDVSSDVEQAQQTPEAIVSVRDEPIEPITVEAVTEPKKVELGKMLWFDTRLSKSGTLSCNSCHDLAKGGTDNIPTSVGYNWAEGPINSPTVLNSRYSLAQFWDGRAKDLMEQAGGPIENPIEMASSHEFVVQVLNSIPEYKALFQEAFGTQGDINIEQVTSAIALFEDTLVTPNSRFDKWLGGDDKALSAQELNGYKLFKDSGCIACHNGAAVGGGSFQKFGVFDKYTTQNLAEGRYAVTGKEEDKGLFKVPTLRNIELTYPYFHDGQVNSLAEAVNIMGRIQLNREFTPEETADIVAFLKTLTGDQPNIKLPILPPSNENTPKPEPFSKQS
ncbi:cytochrome-c peroxidase [Psychrobacter phenylpyruvicus]|uniref:Cytochrome c551 peroxidase n=1 Tax=Psychrobacter phenylpyruvicus TaxID=29432 RepID=A0A379LQU8_9GAMM|nr:cytochrome-c peroxidase [Psychrobacter phenylpyruvicus]SUD92114.1 Cytochrome c551 peroxidase precursor [Psychrobacter phenylpyruvicus]